MKTDINKIKKDCKSVIRVKKSSESQSLLEQKKVKDIKNNKYLYAIYRAMKQIGKQHSAVIVQIKENDPYKININERNYIIFLSYILGTIQGRLKDKIIGRHDFINGEIFKKIESTDKSDIKEAHERYNKIKETKNKEIYRDEEKKWDFDNVRPDFVIHQSQKRLKDNKGQKLIIEAKADSVIGELDFCWDLLKLNYYLKEYDFHNAIYLIVNTEITIIEERLAYYIEKIGYLCSEKKLWFFVQNWDGKKFKAIEIYQIKIEKNGIVVTSKPEII